MMRLMLFYICLEFHLLSVPILVLAQCSDEPSVTMGTAAVDNGASNPYPEDTTATVSCNSGYGSTVKKIKCKGGNWEAVTCTKACGTLIVTHGTVVVGDDTAANTTATFTCQGEYQPKKSPVTCTNGNWEAAECISTHTGCTQIPTITNGNTTVTGTAPYANGTIATVTCKSGYDATAQTTMCLNGVWQSVECTTKGGKKSDAVVISSATMTIITGAVALISSKYVIMH